MFRSLTRALFNRDAPRDAPDSKPPQSAGTVRRLTTPRDPATIKPTADAVRAEVEGTVELPDLEWMKQSGPFKRQEQFLDSAFHAFQGMLTYTDINPESRVLDYGCGLARMAIPLSAYLTPGKGSYTGVDTDAQCIERNRRVFAAYPHMRFEHVNLYSSMYNPQGDAFKTLEGRDFGGPFDLAFLFSVFTHILPEDCDLLLRVLRAQLFEDAELFSSWFLLDEDSERGIKEGKSQRSFPHLYGKARITHKKTPEGAVAYFAADALERMQRAGFEDLRTDPGFWRGTNESSHGQDFIVARAG